MDKKKTKSGKIRKTRTEGKTKVGYVYNPSSNIACFNSGCKIKSPSLD